MSFEEFQNRARLYVIGALEDGGDRGVREGAPAVRTEGGRFHRRMLSPA